jgi:putative nucleotidyltransferase with HDIG domain
MHEGVLMDPFAVVLAEIRGPAVLCEDMSGNVLIANDAWVRMLDGDTVHTSTFAILDRLYPDEIARAREKLTAAQENGQPVEFQARLKLGQRAGDWVTIVRSPARDETGEIQGWITSVTTQVAHLDPLDISGAERSLEDKGARLAGIGAWEFQIASGAIWWSAGIYQLFGRDPVDYEPNYEHFLESIHPADREMVVHGLELAQAGEAPYDVRHRIIRPDGEILFVREKAEVDRDESGVAVRMIGTVEDVTAETHEMLRRQRASRALATLTRANAVLIHSADEETLLRQMCGAAVEAGGYPLAWYGQVRSDGTFEVLALNAERPAHGYLSKFNIREGGSLATISETLHAARSGVPLVVRKTTGSVSVEPWRAKAGDYGLCSSVSLSVRRDGVLDGLLLVYSVEEDAFDADAVEILGELAQELGYGLGKLFASRRLTGALEGTIRVLAATVELRDPYTAGHQSRVSNLAAQIASRLNLSESEVHGIRLAGLVHDIGKVTVPTEFLTRPGVLRPAELELIREHAKIGEDLLSTIDFPWPIASIVGQHHERLDGSGYPRGLTGNEILLPSRIMAVADVVEAMSRFRPYREALGEDLAIAEIRANRGILFDPDVVDACLDVLASGFAFEGQI